MKTDKTSFVWNADIFSWSDKHKEWVRGLNWEQISKVRTGFPIWQIEKHFNNQITELNAIFQEIYKKGEVTKEDIQRQYTTMIEGLLNTTNEAFREIAGIQYDVESTDMKTGAIKLKWVK